MKTFAIVLYYIAIFVLIFFVGVVGYRLLFGTPCTIVGNYCVGDGWSIAGLAATILGIAATVLGILGAFALAAWWTDLKTKVEKQVDANMKKREKILYKQFDKILAEQEAEMTERYRQDLINISEITLSDLTDTANLVHSLGIEIKSLRTEYEDISKMAEEARDLAIDRGMFGFPWDNEYWAMNVVSEYHQIGPAVRMIDKYLLIVDGFLNGNPSEKGKYMTDLKKSGAPSADFQWFWNAVLRWQELVNSIGTGHPEIVKQVNDKVESYQKRIDEARQNAAHDV